MPRINTYLCTILITLFAAGCETTKNDRREKKEMTLLRFHVETNPDGSERTHIVPVYRANPSMISIGKVPALDEGSIAQAALVDSPGGGFVISIQFTHHGRLLLDNLSNAYRGQRLAIMANFGETRWLAAPQLTRRISDGVFTFTPDATREESERIVRGLMNVSKKLKNNK